MRMIVVVSLALLLCGSCASIGEAVETPASDGRYALLIGVTKYPVRNNRDDLDGPANDTELLRDVLTSPRFGFLNDDNHMRILSENTGARNAECLPTRSNIAREFKRLASNGLLKRGDQVMILLSGHGSQQP